MHRRLHSGLSVRPLNFTVRGRHCMPDPIAQFAALPGYGIGAVVVLVVYAIQSELRFGARARTIRAGSADRQSTLAVSVCAAVPILGFVLAMKASSDAFAALTPHWFRIALLPGLPMMGWLGVVLGSIGISLRLWAVLRLRDRYTRTLLVQHAHTIERGGPYRWVRHPGYAGSMLVLNGVALASGNWMTFLASLLATVAAYTYRIRVEDGMLLAAFGESFAEYRRQVPAVLPSLLWPR